MVSFRISLIDCDHLPCRCRNKETAYTIAVLPTPDNLISARYLPKVGAVTSVTATQNLIQTLLF
ncbi:hypothetical protein [Snodgrassella alvi]|uniref:hypothetical protein n=1 Tax=Snodgrassella alvi TaxID=1196083 RepID=UPI0034E2D273